jgi:hypothetical protein
MAVTWRNDGEKTEDGEYVVDLDAENGTPVQTFRAKTRKDIATLLAEAQLSGSITITTLKQERTPERAPLSGKIEPVPLSADERMRLAIDLQDPAKADGAVKRLIESAVGPLDLITRRENERIEREEEERAIAETHKFVAANPDWYPTAKNKTEVFNYIENNKLAITANNMGIAWDLLKSTGNADLKPATPAEEDEEPATPNGNGTRPRIAAFSTGLREGDTTNLPAVPRKQKYTWADVDKMGAREYERRLKDEPGFMAAMDALGPRR